MCDWVCVLVRGTNRRKINRCEEEQTDMLLSVGGGAGGGYGYSGGRYVKRHTHKHTSPFFYFRRSRWLYTCTRPFYLVNGDERKRDCHKITNKELRENLKKQWKRKALNRIELNRTESSVWDGCLIWAETSRADPCLLSVLTSQLDYWRKSLSAEW